MRLLEWLTGYKPTTEAEKSAIAEFLALHPGERIAWTRITAEEEARYVVGVFYGNTAPPRYQFFAVPKATYMAQVLEDDENYRPKVWR